MQRMNISQREWVKLSFGCRRILSTVNNNNIPAARKKLSDGEFFLITVERRLSERLLSERDFNKSH